MGKTKLGIFFSLILILWVCLIFYFSSQPSRISNNQSKIVLKILNKLDITDTKIYNKAEEIFMEDILMGRYRGANSMVRKSAHFGMYFILGILSSILSYIYSKKVLIAFLLGMNFPVTIAVLDEFNQSFMDRTSSLYDVIIDGMGALTGSLFIITLIGVFRVLKLGTKLYNSKSIK